MEPRIYTPRETREFERRVAASALAAGVHPLRGRVSVEVEVYLAGRRGDGDNYLKAVLDGLNGVAWEDDSQVSYASIRVIRVERRADERTEILVRSYTRR